MRESLIGATFGRLFVKEDDGKRTEQGKIMYLCECECGSVLHVRSDSLSTGNTTSCGCLKKEVFSTSSINRKSRFEGTDVGAIARSLPSNNTTGIKGVYKVKNRKWLASITVKRKQIYLGTFDDKQDAINARLEAEEKYFTPIIEKYEKQKNLASATNTN